jgi:hypothetical protein
VVVDDEDVHVVDGRDVARAGRDDLPRSEAGFAAQPHDEVLAVRPGGAPEAVVGPRR